MHQLWHWPLKRWGQNLRSIFILRDLNSFQTRRLLSKFQTCGAVIMLFISDVIFVMMWSSASLSRYIQKLATLTMTGCKKMHDSSTPNSSLQVGHHSWCLHTFTPEGDSVSICGKRGRKKVSSTLSFSRNELLFPQPWLCPLEADC